MLRDGPRQASQAGASGRWQWCVGASWSCRGPACGAALVGQRGGHAGRGAMVRRGAVATWRPATSQDGTSALVLAASGGHNVMVELLLDRGADLEAKDRVSAAAVCCFATGHAGCHGRVPRRGDGGDESGRRAAIAGRRGMRRRRGGMSAGGRWCDELLCRAGLRRRSTVQRRLLWQRGVAARTWWSYCWTGAPTWRPRTA